MLKVFHIAQNCERFVANPAIFLNQYYYNESKAIIAEFSKKIENLYRVELSYYKMTVSEYVNNSYNSEHHFNRLENEVYRYEKRNFFSKLIYRTFFDRAILDKKIICQYIQFNRILELHEMIVNQIDRKNELDRLISSCTSIISECDTIVQKLENKNQNQCMNAGDPAFQKMQSTQYSGLFSKRESLTKMPEEENERGSMLSFKK
jgi:hypothetical protein